MSRLSGLERLRSFPRAPAPNDDATAVKTNLPEDAVRLLQNILAYHVADYSGSNVFGHEQGKGLELVEAFVRTRHRDQDKAQDRLEAVTVCELLVEHNMLNVHGTFAGACAVHMVDIATFSPLFALATVTGFDPSGFSTSMNVIWHAPAIAGSRLRFVGTSLSCRTKMASAQCEVYDVEKGTLILSATHIIAPMHARGGVVQADDRKHRAKL
ncbi:hypothetical protein GSI_03032 [Ganoderma sinense ZZ0214-1]|uniref:Thioesterase domain-containing protein n=1 Tax=Ganoderma sinense ZZ0214-1 TaxID=1077348 RepID=A0A2G8SN99_9APHY|nr:hypothetical protein GSI_03032 [Ganoderma sinense ZZ0214-1]